MSAFFYFRRFLSNCVNLVFGILLSSFYACSGEESTAIVKSDVLEVSASQLSWQVDDAGNVFQIQFSASGSWTATINEDASGWMSISPSQGEVGNCTLKVTVQENLEKNERKGAVILQCGESRREISVTQRAYVPSIQLLQKEFTVSCEKETVEIGLRANVMYRVEILSPDWIMEVETRAYADSTHYFLIEKNEGYSPRTGEIRFVDDVTGVSETVRIIQEQKEAIFVDAYKYEISSEGGTFEVIVHANVEVNVAVSDGWIKLMESRGLTDSVLVFSVDENMDKEERMATVTITGTDVSQTLMIVQEGTFQPGGGLDDMPIEPW